MSPNYAAGAPRVVSNRPRSRPAQVIGFSLVKFVVAEFVLYALAAFAVGVAAGTTWQRRPIRRAGDRVRLLERAKLSADQRWIGVERECAAMKVELDEARAMLGSVTELRSRLAEANAERQAAVAAREAADLRSTRLRSDLDARTLPTFTAVRPTSADDDDASDLVARRAEQERQGERELADRLELVRRNEALNASLTERLLAAERHVRDLQHRHNSYVRSAQAALTAAVVRAEQAEASLSVARATLARVGPADAAATVIDLRAYQPAEASGPEPA